jgi:hypothetical protein
MHLIVLRSVSFATGGDDAAGSVIALVLLLLLCVIGFVFYFLPTLIAIFRHHHQWGAITIINVFFGWTFIGWVVSLAWAVSARSER